MEDLPKIVELENMSFDNPYPESLFHVLLKQYPEGFLVAEVDGMLAGYCVISPLKEKRTMIINSLAVHPRLKRERIGTSLLESAIKLAKRVSPPVERIVLQVATINAAARALYSNFGFVYSFTIKHYYGKNRDGIQMELSLVRETAS